MSRDEHVGDDDYRVTVSPEQQANPDVEPWCELAGRALQLSLNGRPEQAWAAVHRMAVAYGANTVPTAMQAWIDTMLQQRGVHGFASSVRLGFVNGPDGRVLDVDDVPTAQAWAGRLTAARAANDEPAFRALIRAVPRELWEQHVWTLLYLCALNIRAAANPHTGGRRG